MAVLSLQEKYPRITTREVGEEVDSTERNVRIIINLKKCNYLIKIRDGRNA